MSENEEFTNVLSEVYHALSASRRRHVIQILSNSNERTLPVRDLAREITAIEEGVPPERATGEPYRNVYNALAQTHLSTLSDAGVIIYDTDRQKVAVGPNLDITALLIVLNHATYRVLQEDSFPNSEDLDTSITD